MKITELVPDRQNANKGTQRGLKELDRSLRRNGAGRSILIDKHNRIIAGNKTTERAADIGLEDVIVVETDGTKLVAVKRTDLDLDDGGAARELAYADNWVGQIDLDWDAEQVLADLETGSAELQEMLKDLAEHAGIDILTEQTDDPGAQIDKAEELREKWQTETGQLWRVGEHRVVCGDCTDAAVVARVMQGEKAELVVTDPPYGVNYSDKNTFLNAISRGNRIQAPIENDKEAGDAVQAVWKAAFHEMNTVMDAGAVVYCFMPQGGDQMMMMMMMMGAGIEPRHELIWLKNNHVLGRVDYAYKHEPILYAWKAGGHKFYGDFQTSILEFPKPQKSDLHPTTKPVELIERLVSNSSVVGGTVFDPFLGSGTTLVACERLGRKGRGIEISPAYVAVTLERLAGMGLTPELCENAI